MADVRRALAAAGPPVPSPVEQDGYATVGLPPPVLEMVARGGTPRPAAVLVALYDHALDGGPSEAWVVLTRRSMTLRNHAGEVSFPGGLQEPADLDLTVTARREAAEEVDLDPATVDIFGELDHLSTISSGSFIVPFVAALPGRPDLRPADGEVSAVLHVPLSELLDPAHYREQIWTIGEYVRPIVFIDLVGDTVWGATAAMLRQLLGLVTGTVGRGELDHD